MSNFVADGTLPPVKTDKTPLPGTEDPNKAIVAADWNALRQALLDLRDFLTGVSGPVDLLIGDSNCMGAGADATKTAAEYQVLTADQTISFRNRYATAASDPPTFIIQDTGALRSFNFSSADRFGPERGLMQTLYSQLYAGRGIRPVCLKFAISGIKAADWTPTSSYMLASTGKRLYDTWRDDTLALLSVLGRQAGSLSVVLGGNDGTNSTDANNLQTSLTAIFNQALADFGHQLIIALVRVSANVDPAVVTQLSTVRTKAAAAVAATPNARLVDSDRAALNGDLIHWTGDAQEDIGAELAFAVIDGKGSPRATVPAAPVAIVGYGIPGYGTTANGTGTVKPQPWAGTLPGDTLLMYVTQGFAGTSIATPAGWTAKANGSSTAIAVTEVYAVFEKKLVEADFDSFGRPTAVTVPCAGGNTENAAQIFTLRGPRRGFGVEAALAVTDNNYNTGPLSATSVTPLTMNALLVCFAGGLSALGGAITIANAGIPNLVRIKDSVYLTNTDYRGISVAAGNLGSPSNPGAWSLSGATNCFKGVITVSVAE